MPEYPNPVKDAKTRGARPSGRINLRLARYLHGNRGRRGWRATPHIAPAADDVTRGKNAARYRRELGGAEAHRNAPENPGACGLARDVYSATNITAIVGAALVRPPHLLDHINAGRNYTYPRQANHPANGYPIHYRPLNSLTGFLMLL